MRSLRALAISALSFVAAAQAATSYVPLTLWASNGILEHRASDNVAKNANAEYSVDQIASTLKFLQDNGETVKDALDAHTPFEVMYPRAKAVVLFVRESLRLDEMENFEGTPVEEVFRNATSSVTYPHTVRAADDNLIDALKPTHSTDIEELKKFAQDVPTLGSIGKTDLVVVKIPNKVHWSEAAKLIHSSVALFNRITGDRAIYGLTGSQPTEFHANFNLVHRSLLAAASVAAPLVCPPGSFLSTAHSEPFCFTHYVNMTPTILAGLVLSFFFLFCVYIGLYSLDSIQTPLKYPSVAPPKGKEY